MELFDQLRPETRERLDAASETVHLKTGEYLIRRGDEGGDMFRLLSGRLEIVDGRSRPEFILRVLGPGAVVGEMSFLGRGARTADVRAGEASVAQRWRRGALEQALEAEAAVAADFYRAAARVLAERLDVLTHITTSSNPGERSGGSEWVSASAADETRAVADVLKAGFREAEELLRVGRPRHEIAERLSSGLKGFTARGRQVFEELELEDEEAVSALLAQELRPYLVRSRLAEQALAPRDGQSASRAPMLAHLALGNPRGSDPLGRLLDELLLGLPTAVAYRDRAISITRLAMQNLPAVGGGALRALVIGAGTGALVAALGRPIMEQGGELTCIDNDREALAYLESGTSVRSSRLSLRLVHTDLPAFVQGASDIFLTPQDLIVIDDLLEYLPDRVVAALAREVLELLQPGAQMMMGFLASGDDDFIFEHLLRWPMIRRDPPPVAEMLESVGFVDVRMGWRDGIGNVVMATRPQR